MDTAGPGDPATDPLSFPAPPSGPRHYSAYYPVPAETSRSIKGLGIATQVLLALQVASAVGLLFRVLDERSLITKIRDHPGSVSLSEAQHADDTTSAAATIVLVSYLVTGIVWIIWFYRARRNVEAWDQIFQRRGSGWAIGAWFCPIVNLWFPYMISRDILDDTERDPADSWPDRPHRPLLMLWWLCFVGLDLVILYGNGSANTDTISGIEHTNSVAIVSVVIRIAAAALAIAVVGQITRAQTRRRAAE